MPQTFEKINVGGVRLSECRIAYVVFLCVYSLNITPIRRLMEILVHYKISYSWPLRELMDVHVAFLPRMFSAD